MKYIKDLSISNKLFVLLLLLSIPLIFFLISHISPKVQQSNKLEDLIEKLEEEKVISDLIHQLQLERALAHGYYYSEGENFTSELQLQRKLVDLGRNNYRDLYRNNTNKRHFDFSNDLQNIRSEIDRLIVDSLNLQTFYSNVINELINRIEVSPYMTDDVQIRMQINAMRNLTLAKVNIGAARRTLIKTFTLNTLTNSEREYFIEKYGLYREYLKNFEEQAPAHILNFVHKKYQNQKVKEAVTILDGFAKGTTSITSYSPTYIYDRLLVYTNGLKDIENFIIKNNIKKAREVLNEHNRTLFIFLLILVITLSISFILAFYIIKLISSAIGELKSVADKVALGRTNLSLDYTSKDEFGELANSFRSVITKNLHLSLLAEAIGNGNYDIIPQVADGEDTLGNALKQMREKLLNLSIKESRNNWMLKGDAKINDIVRGEKDLHGLAHNILNFLVQHLNASIGVFYLYQEDNTLLPLATSALSVEDVQKEISGSLISQAALERKIVRLEHLPENYFTIKTGLGKIPPKDVIIFPISNTEKTLAVVELGSREEFTELHKEFIESISEKLAIVIENISSNIKTVELLEESQRQAEELEAQQEELRSLNEGLHHQTQKLQASEEELRSNEEELQEKNTELEEKAQQLEEQYELIRGKNTALEDARQAIQEKVDELERTGKFKSEFLANMSHELRTPLNSILILSKLLEENKGKNLTQKQVELASVINRSGTDLLTLINDILDLSKIESGKVSIDLGTIELKNLTMQWQFEELAKSKKLSFSVDMDPSLPNTIVTDSFKVEQVLKNLISNAFKFTPEGGSVSLKIFPTVFKNQKMIAFQVKDTGIGIAKDHYEKVFKAFQQVDSSISRQYGGTGLGLSISREISQLLGGDILLESEIGKGSTFTLYIPAKHDAFSEEKIQLPPKFIQPLPVLPTIKKEPNGEQRTILIVEDDLPYASILEDFVIEQNYKALVAYNGEKALQMAKEFQPDAILLDLKLPDISGWKVLENLKGDKKLYKIPVHIVSSSDKEQNLESREASYLVKPVSFEVLTSTLNQLKNKSDIKTILIVEDDKGQNRAIKELLASHDFESYSVFTGKEAEYKLEREIYDCVILDINLPDVNGYTLLEKLKQKPDLEEIPFIIYSGKVLTEEEERKIRKYASTIVIKAGLSYERLIDEVNLFIKKVEEQSPLKKEVITTSKNTLSDNLADKKVLIVDDDIRNIFSLYNVLEQHDLRIITADNGVEALEKLKENEDIDIILMDIMMPEMDGFEAIKRIRQRDIFKNTPIIALTAKAMKGDREKCIEVGASDYISKPIDVDKLLSLMRVWLYNKK